MFELSISLKDEARWKGSRETVEPFSKGKEKVQNRAQSFARTLYGHDLRFVVIHSDQLEAMKMETLHRQMTKERTGNKWKYYKATKDKKRQRRGFDR